MGWVKTHALSVLGVLALVGTAPAQATLSVSPSPVLEAGGEATISYSDPNGDQGDLVIVIIDNGGVLNHEFDVVVIELDENGEGSATWQVPANGWVGAVFTAPGAPEVTCAIVRPGVVVD